jgi:hypothetical protein
MRGIYGACRTLDGLGLEPLISKGLIMRCICGAFRTLSGSGVESLISMGLEGKRRMPPELRV